VTKMKAMVGTYGVMVTGAVGGVISTSML
jgi:hypothetical protein